MLRYGQPWYWECHKVRLRMSRNVQIWLRVTGDNSSDSCVSAITISTNCGCDRAGSLCEYMMWLGSIYSIYSHTWRLYLPKLRKIICEMPWCTYQLFMTTPFFASGSKNICSPWKQDIYTWKLLVTAVFEDDHLWMTFRLREWVF